MWRALEEGGMSSSVFSSTSPLMSVSTKATFSHLFDDAGSLGECPPPPLLLLEKALPVDAGVLIWDVSPGSPTSVCCGGASLAFLLDP